MFLRPWTELPLVVIDLETTGPPNNDPIEVGMVRIEDGVIVNTFQSLVQPPSPVNPAATKVHGLTDADVDKAWPISEALASQDAHDAFHDAAPVAYYHSFDKPLLQRDPTLAGAPCFHPHLPWIDPLVWVRRADKYVAGSGRHKLGAACERRGIMNADAHRALGDAEATAQLLLRLIEDRDIFTTCTLGELLYRQGKLEAEQQADYERYKAQQAAEPAPEFTPRKVSFKAPG